MFKLTKTLILTLFLVQITNADSLTIDKSCYEGDGEFISDVDKLTVLDLEEISLYEIVICHTDGAVTGL